MTRLPHLFLAAALLILAAALPAWSQVYPSAPQGPTSADGIDAGTGTQGGFVRVTPGGNGPVDAFGFCRWVANAGGKENVIPVKSLLEWQYYRAGEQNGQPPPGITETVCCRPQNVTLCQGAAGGTVTQTLPYTPLGQSQSPVSTCIDQWGLTYTDSQIWTCGQTGSGVMADGLWNENGGDHYTCSPNAFTSGCTVSCGGGTTTTWDSCGNVQAVNSCNTQSCCVSNGSCSGGCGGGVGTDNCGNFCVNNGSCCSPSYSKSCNGSTATYTDVSCGTGSYSVGGGCSIGPLDCYTQCFPGPYAPLGFPESCGDGSAQQPYLQFNTGSQCALSNGTESCLTSNSAGCIYAQWYGYQ